MDGWMDGWMNERMVSGMNQQMSGNVTVSLGDYIEEEPQGPRFKFIPRSK